MSEYQIKNTIRYLIIFGFSTLLIVSFQNCQGVDSQIVMQSLNAPGGDDNGGSGVDPIIEEPPEQEPEEPPVIIPDACDLGNEAPSWTEQSISNAENGAAVFLSAIDEMSGARMLSTITLRAQAGNKGEDLEESDILAASNCNMRRISGSQNIAVNCNLNGNRLNVDIDNGNNNECIAAEFEVTARVEDSCGATAETTFRVISKNICLPQAVHSHDGMQDTQKPTQSAYYSYGLQKDGNLVAISSPGDNEKYNVGGAVNIYSYNGDGSLNFRDKILPADSRSDQYNVFAMKNGYVAMGSPSLGKVKVYQYQGSSYVLLKTLSFSYSNFYKFGQSLAFFDGKLVVGSPGEKSIYMYSLPALGQLDKYTHTDTLFGEAMIGFSYSGNDYLAVRSAKDNKGRMTLMRWSTASASLEIKNYSSGSHADHAKIMKANNEFLFVGSPGQSKAIAYKLSDVVAFGSQPTPVLNKTEGGSRLGSSFASDDKYIYVGAPREEEGEGVVYVYNKSNGNEVRWIRPRRQNRPANQEFGRSMIMDSGRLYIGAPFYSSQSETLKGRLFYVDMQ